MTLFVIKEGECQERHSPPFLSKQAFMMSDKKKEEEKGEESETDYGSDTWLADFNVDQFIRNWKAVEKHNQEYDRNPYYRMRFNGGKRAQKRERMLKDMRREDKKRMEILRRSEERSKCKKEEVDRRRVLAFQTPPPTNKKKDDGERTAADSNVEEKKANINDIASI